MGILPNAGTPRLTFKIHCIQMRQEAGVALAYGAPSGSNGNGGIKQTLAHCTEGAPSDSTSRFTMGEGVVGDDGFVSL